MQANAAIARANEEAKAAARKTADARAARDETGRELVGARAECAMLSAEIQANVSKEAVIAAARKHYNTTAAFPRHAFTMREGRVLHSSACEGWIDVSKAEPREYDSHKELEGWMASEGVVLCHNCRKTGF